MSKQDVSPRDHRIKIVVVATVAAALVIAIGFWAISSAIKSTKANTETAKTETTQQSEKTEQTSNTTNQTEVVSPSSEYVAAEPAVDLPATGPVDVLISALGLGAIVALILVNIDLVQKQTI